MGHPLATAYPVPALEKGLDILELLSVRKDPPSLAELGRTLGRSSSELFRMLNCLERRGYVVREPSTGRYRLSLRLYELAHAHPPVEELLRAADRPMRALARELRESVHLSVLGSGRLLVLAQVDSPERVRFSVEVGGRHPVATTCSGRLLLAHLPEAELETFLDGDPEFREMKKAQRRKLLSLLLEIRREGFSSTESETFHGVRDVAVLVGNPRVGVAAALCVPTLKIRGHWPSVAEVRRAVEQAASEITRSLGLSTGGARGGGRP
ncbi:MAG TPA: IclR family transcriptional regulator [Planctomycetota bacterium]|nr:IclR family transcriptional regulator [Planctomycetota bacterium]